MCAICASLMAAGAGLAAVGACWACVVAKEPIPSARMMANSGLCMSGVSWDGRVDAGLQQLACAHGMQQRPTGSGQRAAVMHDRCDREWEPRSRRCIESAVITIEAIAMLESDQAILPSAAAASLP